MDYMIVLKDIKYNELQTWKYNNKDHLVVETDTHLEVYNENLTTLVFSIKINGDVDFTTNRANYITYSERDRLKTLASSGGGGGGGGKGCECPVCYTGNEDHYCYCEDTPYCSNNTGAIIGGIIGGIVLLVILVLVIRWCCKNKRFTKKKG